MKVAVKGVGDDLPGLQHLAPVQVAPDQHVALFL